MFTDYNAIEMLKHLSESFPSIQKFIIHFAYLLGLFLAGYGVHGWMTSG
ncbi:MAG: hypothetical protein JXR29_03870 [Methylothermaceae bacterium]|nr:hypothetical protein [Methylothermaceae bacterium]